MMLDPSTIRVQVNGGLFMQIIRRPTGDVYDGYQQHVGQILRSHRTTTVVWKGRSIAILENGGDSEDWPFSEPRRRRVWEDHIRSEHDEMAVFCACVIEVALYGVNAANEGQRWHGSL
jgi:hypothetical protein